jgi:hypothetical protein
MVFPIRRPLAALLTILACSPQDPDPSKPTTAAPAEPTPKRSEDADAAARGSGRVLEDAPVPLAAILGKGPPQVEQLLGEPTQTLQNRISCARFLPERVFFSCVQEARSYADRSGKLEQISIEYEDGRAAAVALTGLVGEGDFSPEKALAVAGLELPGKHRVFHPQENETVWDYWNGEARLIVDGRQHRVQVSVVDGEWPRSKVEVLVNHPLSDDERARIKNPG